MSATVYFSRTITPENVLELFRLVDKPLPGNVAIKLHSGEKGNQNFLGPDFWKPVIDYVGGTVVECNTAYDGERNTTEKHRKLIADHGWSKFFLVDLLDAAGPDLELPIPNGKMIHKNFVGKDIANYDSMLVLSHFKGHPMGGFGGALTQLSIGVASSYGKAYIHGAGEAEKIWTSDHDSFLESMADAASSVVEYFHGNLVYVNVMKNMSVDCDCCAVAEDPCIADIGILVSTDPIAIDQACVDLVYACSDPGKSHLIERIESRNGIHTVEAAAALALADHRARGAAQIDVHLVIAQVFADLQRPEHILHILAQKLGHGGKAHAVCLRQLPGFPVRQTAVDGGGDEGHEIFVHAGEIFVVEPPEGGVGDALQGRIIISHQTSRYPFSTKSVLYTPSMWLRS